MYFLIEDAYLLEKYNTIWDKVSAHGDKVTDFYDNKIPKGHSNHTCLPLSNLDFVLKKDGNYYPQAFLKEPNILRETK